MPLINFLYAQLARARRRYFQQHPHLRRRLEAPVISVGNLTVGGSGKTPLAGAIARMLVDQGERPAILSRGYGRHRPADGVVVVSEGSGGAPRVHIDVAGDEPVMLARSVSEAAVLVSPDRYLAGKLAETRLARSIHILDDGFQHLGLSRDVDLLVTPPDDFFDMRTLPFGRFRESIEAATAADALLVPIGQVRLKPDTTDAHQAPVEMDEKAEMARRLGVPVAFGFERSLGDARVRREPGEPGEIIAVGSARVYAIAGIARPDRFFQDLERAGWQLAGRQRFRDHHRYSSRDVQEIGRRARQSGADVILMTEKDLVRWPVSPLLDVPVASVPLRVVIEPGFQPWLIQRVIDARRRAVA